MANDFTDKVALVTGGARGFGAAFGAALAAHGARVVLADIDGQAAEQGAASLRATGGEAIASSCDVADASAVDRTVAQAVEAFGGIDILINNAGLHSLGYSRPLQELGLAEIRRLYDVNLFGTIACSLACHASMAARGGGVILNISSAASYASQSAYGASKLAIRGITCTLAHDLGAENIRVVGIAPGLTATDTILEELPQQYWEMITAQQALRRRGEVADVVSAMLFLCSDAASFVTGVTLPVGGGYPLVP